MKTKMTELLGIRHPVQQGGMNAATSPELAAAVSNAGGLGTISATQYPTVESFRQMIEETKSLTSAPFAINIAMTPDGKDGGMQTSTYMKIAAEEKVPVVVTAGRSPEEYVPILKKSGVILIHKCTTVKHALKAQAFGADMVTLMGFESGGHPGLADLPLSALIPNAVNALKIPVLVSGGTADGRGLVAALAWGGAGVVVGTRFVATPECPVHQKIKERVLSATEMDTLMIQRSIRNPLRVLKTEFAYTVLEKEKENPTLEELMPLISGKRSREYFAKGEVEQGLFSIGQTLGLVNDIRPAGQVVTDIVAEAEKIIAKLQKIL